VDATLAPGDRTAIEVHLASCETCREIVASTSAVLEELAAGTAEAQDAPALASHAPIPMPRRRRPTLYLLAGLAAAAVLVLALLVPRLWAPSDPGSRPELVELVAAVGPNRPFEPRLTGGFQYGPLAPVMRSGSGTSDVPPEITIAGARAQEVYEARPAPDTAAALASAYLVSGRVDAAIALLEQATRERAGRGAWWSDLAAAYLVRSARTGDAADARLALAAADRALALAPTLREALFNRALALGVTGPAADAARAWEAVRAAERGSSWAKAVPAAGR